MRSMMCAGAAVLALLLAPPARAQQPASGPPMVGVSTIRVSAMGDVQVAPDRAWADFGMETRAPTAQAAGDENARRMERVIAALLRAGVRREDIETRDYSVFPDYAQGRPDQPGEPRIVGYRATNVVTARTDRINQVGPLIDAALAAGANRVHGVRFGLRDPQAARAQAVRRAIERGRAEAETIAAGLGVRLGDVLDASTTSEPMRPYPVAEVAMMARGAAADAPTPIQPGEQTVMAMVSLVYRIIR